MIKVAVIGAGLSGLYAAYSAASHGAEVELIEKSEIGTRHNCGEMFTEVYTTAPEECKIIRVSKFIIKIDGNIFNYEFGELSPFVMTDKCFHEKILRDKCLSLGVKIMERTKLTREHIVDKAVINATGASNYQGNMGKAVDYIVNNERFADVPPGSALFIVRDDLMGYSWAFPKVHSVNCGEGVYDYKFNCTFDRPDRNEILFSGGGILPMPTMQEYYSNVIVGNNITGGIRVGNALGLVNPVLGGGEHLAVLSGILAGELVAKGKEKYYYKALDEIIGDEMRFGISMYEFMKKQDMESVKKLLENNIGIDIKLFNKSIRKSMKKWINLPEVKEDELEKFAGE